MSFEHHHKHVQFPGDNAEADDSSLRDGELIRLSELPRHIPPGRNGKKRHPSTIYRYVLKGVRGVRLEYRQLPDGMYTTLPMWDRFVQRLPNHTGRIDEPVTLLPSHTETKNQTAVEARIESVRASIRRKGSGTPRAAAAAIADLKPHYDAERRELRIGNRLCKRFRQPAKNQLVILSAFEEERWPKRIDDPLPPDSKSRFRHRQRLADAVRRLNNNPFLRFELDGTSTGILWSLSDAST